MKTLSFLFPLLLAFQLLFAQQQDTIVYDAAKGIKWSYFRGAPNRDTLAALISTSLYLQVEKVSIWDGRITFKSYAVMHPSESWVKPEFKEASTLQHEQTHFNIAEVCARALQADINKLKIRSATSPLIQQTFDKWYGRFQDLEHQYDTETRGGNDATMQQYWNEKVLADLMSH